MAFDWGQYAEGMTRRMGPPRPPAVLPPMGRLYNGILTLQLPDGGHRTFRIRSGYDGTKHCGRRVVGILIGPQNTTDYQECAYLEPDGFKMFTRVQGTADAPKRIEEFLGIIWTIAGGETVPGFDVMESRHCLRCNRLLTTSQSILTGLGEICEGYA